MNYRRLQLFWKNIPKHTHTHTDTHKRGRSENYFYKFTPLRSYIKAVYYIFRIAVHTLLFYIITLYTETYIPPVHQFIDISEELCALFLQVCPCCFHGFKIWFEMKDVFSMAQTGGSHLGPDEGGKVDDAEHNLSSAGIHCS
jgi:hypothetical protein